MVFILKWLTKRHTHVGKNVNEVMGQYRIGRAKDKVRPSDVERDRELINANTAQDSVKKGAAGQWQFSTQNASLSQ